MTIFARLLEKAEAFAKEESLVLERLSIGGSFTYAQMSSAKGRGYGVALTPSQEGEIRALDTLDIEEIFKCARSYDLTYRAAALAIINAMGSLLRASSELELFDNIQEKLSKELLSATCQKDRIVFIGNLKPVVASLKDGGRSVIVFCRNRDALVFEEQIYSDIFEYEALLEADVVVITGAALVASTIDALLLFCTKARMVVLAGFSAGAYAQWYRGMGFTHLISLHLEAIEDCDTLTPQKLFCHKAYFETL